MTRLETAIIVTGWSAIVGLALWTWELQLAGSMAQ